MNSFLWLAVVLVVIWIVARIFLAVTSVALHLLWVAGIILLVIWVIKKIAT